MKVEVESSVHLKWMIVFPQAKTTTELELSANYEYSGYAPTYVANMFIFTHQDVRQQLHG